METFDETVQYLIIGFCRKIQTLILDQIIPSAVIVLCAKFYDCKIRIILYHQTSNNNIPNIIVSDLYHKKTYNYSIVATDESSHLVKDAGLCYAHNVQIPNTMRPISLNAAQCDVLFTFGGTPITAECNGYIIPPKHHEKQIYFFKLPSLLTRVRGTYAVYSKIYGLIQIGGYNQNCFNVLSFNDSIDKDEWKWQHINTMDRSRSFLSATMLDNDKLICCGGYDNYNYLSYTDMYDFKTNEWTQLANINKNRCRAGICVDRIYRNRVYLGGGAHTGFHDGALKDCEYYEINKNIWIELPLTNKWHGSNPIVWIDGKNILYIASTWSNCIESIDLRESEWRIESESKTKDENNFVNLFGIKIQKLSYVHRLCI
eukprot:443191_1